MLSEERTGLSRTNLWERAEVEEIHDWLHCPLWKKVEDKKGVVTHSWQLNLQSRDGVSKQDKPFSRVVCSQFREKARAYNWAIHRGRSHAKDGTPFKRLSGVFEKTLHLANHKSRMTPSMRQWTLHLGTTFSLVTEFSFWRSFDDSDHDTRSSDAAFAYASFRCWVSLSAVVGGTGTIY